MKHRILSNPIFFEGEGALINQLFRMGLPCFHFRKPVATVDECRGLLEEIDPSYYPRIIMHKHQYLAVDYQLKGVHIKTGDWEVMNTEEQEEIISFCKENRLNVGTGIHATKQLDLLPPSLDYVMASPVFPSISKTNYLPKEAWDVNDKNMPFAIVGLGGMDAHNLLQAAVKGFEEVAFLGAIWGEYSKVIDNYKLICTKLSIIDHMY